ncbi:GTPase HflX [Halobacteriales archaeon QS_8_69_26]|nr:MAG: GTPase HflX [Halobacteriales archaeon QS_8_69_26]
MRDGTRDRSTEDADGASRQHSERTSRERTDRQSHQHTDRQSHQHTDRQSHQHTGRPADEPDADPPPQGSPDRADRSPSGSADGDGREGTPLREPAPDVDPKGRAVVARRADPGESADTKEIAALAAAAGYAVVGTASQARPEDPGTNLGDGKVDELVALVAETDADAVVVDNELTPAQTVELEDRLPGRVEVLDRYRLVLGVFAEGAGTERARLQVEHARLRYELPRIKERAGGHRMSKWTEKGTPVQDVEKRIETIERKLDSLPTPAERHRERRREQGFDLVAVAGYTNAGKSTLLHRLADDLDVTDHEPDHPDRDATAAVQDRLFKTLETTTRKATVGDREALVTDTVGFVDELPHELVESFSTTIDEVGAADVAVLVADAADPPDRLRGKVETALSVVANAETPVVVALNKVDLLDAEELDERRAALADLAADPVAVSAIEGTGVNDLRARVRDALPTETVEVTLPNTDEAMSLVSWAYDHGEVREVEYGDRVRLSFAGRPGVVERLRGTAADLRAGDGHGTGDGGASDAAE